MIAPPFMDRLEVGVCVIAASTHEGLTRRIPGTTNLGLKTGKLLNPISQLASNALHFRPLATTRPVSPGTGVP
jgi:hypothetical protein